MVSTTLPWCITASSKTTSTLRELPIERGYRFSSETDTEVIAHLCTGNSCRAVRCSKWFSVIPQLRGALRHRGDGQPRSERITAALRSLLVIGRGAVKLIASDQLALLPVTRRFFIFLEEGDVGGGDSLHRQISSTNRVTPSSALRSNPRQYDAGDKGAYRHYMQKEILRTAAGAEKHPGRAFQSRQSTPSELGPHADELGQGAASRADHRLWDFLPPGMVARYRLKRRPACRAMSRSRPNSVTANRRCVRAA